MCVACVEAGGAAGERVCRIGVESSRDHNSEQVNNRTREFEVEDGRAYVV